MVDGALDAKPSTRAVPSVRNTSASSMQSPASQRRRNLRHHLIRQDWLGLGHGPGPGAGQPVGAGPGAGPTWAGKEQSGISHQTAVVEG